MSGPHSIGEIAILLQKEGRPYQTGCTQHCNDGADCTEKVMICKTACVNEKRPERTKWPTKPIPPMGWEGLLANVVISALSAGCAVALISLGVGWAYQTFFTN